MTCPDCGKELVELGELTEDEIHDLEYLQVQEQTIKNEFNNIKINDFSDTQVYEFYRAKADMEALFNASHYLFFRNLAKRFELTGDWSIRIVNNKVCNH